MLLGAAAAVASCAQSDTPPEPTPILVLPESVLLAEHAPPFYSLQESSAGGQWIAVFADAADLTLRLARGSLAAPQAHVDEVVTIDRIDIVPGINPYFGRHAYLQHDGIEHLFYTDQELADARVTKWIYRSVDDAEPWTVDLLPEPVLPVGVLPGPAAGSEHPGFTLFGLLGDNRRTARARVRGSARPAGGAIRADPCGLPQPAGGRRAGRCSRRAGTGAQPLSLRRPPRSFDARPRRTAGRGRWPRRVAGRPSRPRTGTAAVTLVGGM